MAEIHEFVVCESSSSYYTSEPFRKFMVSDEAKYLLEFHPNAFKLLTYIALYVRLNDGHPDGMKAGECFIGDYLKSGIKTEKMYRTAKDILVERGHIKILETCRNRKKGATGRATTGTRVSLISTSVYNSNINFKGDLNGDRRATEGRPKGDVQRKIKKEQEKQQQQPEAPTFIPNPPIPLAAAPSIEESFEQQPQRMKFTGIPGKVIQPDGSIKYYGPYGEIFPETEEKILKLDQNSDSIAKKNLSEDGNIIDIIGTPSESVSYDQERKPVKQAKSSASSMPKYYPILDKIESRHAKISLEDKVNLSRIFSEEDISKAIRKVNSYKEPRTNTAGAIRNAIENGYEYIPTAEDLKIIERESRDKLIEENRQWAQDLIEILELTKHDLRMVDAGYEEVTLEGRYERFELVPFSNKNFKVRLEHYLKKKEKWILAGV